MKRVIGLLVGVGLLSGVSFGIINPNFTPKHLVEQADMVFAGKLTQAGNADEWKLAVDTHVKAKVAASQVLSLAGCDKQHAEDIQKALQRNGDGPIVLYAGTLSEEKRAYAHVMGLWLDVKAAGKDRWAVKGYAPHMSGTYAGGTDKLIIMSKYLADDPDAGVPVTAGVRWMENIKIADMPGAIGGMAAVEFGPANKKGRRALHLFVACDKGDRLYRPKKDTEAFEDVTAAAKLDTKSRRFLWLDVNGDGLADLISWDGTSISVRLGGEKGVLSPAGKLTKKLNADCLALSACSTDGRPGILISTRSVPLLWSADAKAGWRAAALPGGDEAFGEPSACVVGDLNGDGFTDILQPCDSGGALWKGKAGGFAKPVRSKVSTRGGTACVAVGDFDENGSLDVFLVGPQQNTLWENDGKGKFKEVFRFSGSMSYKCPAGASDVQVMDLNHDGRPDMCLIYESSDILYHWSRGFRAFGEEGEVRLPGTETEPGQRRLGQKAMAVGDFNGDGSLDLAVMVTNGQLRCYYNERMDMPALRLRLPKGVTGPVTVSCWMGDKHRICTGTTTVDGNARASYVTARDPGKVTVRYLLPGKGKREVKVAVDEGAKDVVIETRKK